MVIAVLRWPGDNVACYRELLSVGRRHAALREQLQTVVSDEAWQADLAEPISALSILPDGFPASAFDDLSRVAGALPRLLAEHACGNRASRAHWGARVGGARGESRGVRGRSLGHGCGACGRPRRRRLGAGEPAAQDRRWASRSSLGNGPAARAQCSRRTAPASSGCSAANGVATTGSSGPCSPMWTRRSTRPSACSTHWARASRRGARSKPTTSSAGLSGRATCWRRFPASPRIRARARRPASLAQFQPAEKPVAL